MWAAMRTASGAGRPGPRPVAYSRAQVALHWIIAALILVQYSTSGTIVRTHSVHMIGQRPSRFDLLMHVVHNRAGLLIVALMIGRLLLRFWWGVPIPGGAGRSPASRAAAVVHAAFYAVLIAEGATGAIASYFWWPISSAHVILFKILLGLLAAHVAAALWHQIYLRNGILARVGFRRILGWPAPGDERPVQCRSD